MSDTRTQPGIRWGGIVWGALFVLAAGAGILVLAVPDPEAAVGWIRPILFGLRPEWLGAVVPLTVGALVITLGVYFVVRRERGRAASAEAVGADPAHDA